MESQGRSDLVEETVAEHKLLHPDDDEFKWVSWSLNCVPILKGPPFIFCESHILNILSTEKSSYKVTNVNS